MTGSLSYGQLEGVWDQAAAGTPYAGSKPSPLAGYTWDQLMAAIAEAESGGRPDATNPTDNGGAQTSWGLWQISTGTHAAPAPNWSDPIENADLAIGKLRSQGLGAWGTYDTGAELKYLSGSTPAAAFTSASSGGSNPYGNVQWWNPASWLRLPGDAASAATQTVTSEVVHYGAIGLAAGLGLVLVVLGLARATHAREHAENISDAVTERAGQAATVAAVAA